MAFMPPASRAALDRLLFLSERESTVNMEVRRLPWFRSQPNDRSAVLRLLPASGLPMAACVGAGLSFLTEKHLLPFLSHRRDGE